MYVMGKAHILELFTNTILLSRTFDSAVKIKWFFHESVIIARKV
jgi:hypothetical protein